MSVWPVASHTRTPHHRVSDAKSLPDLAAAHAMILAERAARIEAEAAAARAAAVSSGTETLIARLKLEIEKLRRELYGSHSERKARLLEQMELQLEDLEADATEDELAAERAPRCTVVQSFERQRPSRKPFPEHLPRERIVMAAPESCPCCGSTKLSKVGEDVTETLEVIPASVQGHADGAREVLVPAVRDRHTAAGAVPCDAARLRRTEPADWWCYSRSSASISR
jgi:hypothetical protein